MICNSSRFSFIFFYACADDFFVGIVAAAGSEATDEWGPRLILNMSNCTNDTVAFSEQQFG